MKTLFNIKGEKCLVKLLLGEVESFTWDVGKDPIQPKWGPWERGQWGVGGMGCWLDWWLRSHFELRIEWDRNKASLYLRIEWDLGCWFQSSTHVACFRCC